MKTKALIVAGLDKETVSFEFIDGINGTKVVKFEKQILKKGIFAHPQFPNDPEQNINYNDKIFDDIIVAFEAKALDNVPIIIGTHDEEKTKNIGGKVTALIKKKDGLYAIMEITDDEIVAAINAKTSDGKGVIDEVSVSLAPVTDDQGNSFPIALWHVAIVTHAFYKGMNSFEQLAASLEGQFDKILYSLNAEDLQQKMFKIRRAFHHQKSNSFDPIFVEEIHEDFLIAINDSTGELFKFSFDEGEEGIKFGDPVKVRKTFETITARLEDSKLENEEKTQLQLLADMGIKVDSVSELKEEHIKKLLEAANKPDPKPEPKPEPTEADKVVAKLKAALGVDDKPDGKEVDLVKAVSALTATLENQGKQITDLQGTLSTTLAETSVDAFIKEGKIIPAQKEEYISLYASNKELFDKMVEKNPKLDITVVGSVVSIDDDGYVTAEGTELDFADNASVEKDTKRLMATAKAMSTNGKSEKGVD